MSDELELELAQLVGGPGWRLDRIELFNWGTFDQAVWAFDLGGRNGLLTGDIGSGKSTVVDAISTLLLPANKVAYNRAAGAEAKERTLRTYVQGLYKQESDPDTGIARAVGLRTDRDAQAVLLGVFVNTDTGQAATLLQVFWLRRSNTSQPERFYATATRRLTIAEDVLGPPDVPTLKRALRAAGVAVRDAFGEYATDYRRLLGIPGEQAMELFHQTISMKSVGDLTDFVRRHMLEPFDAERAIATLIDHVEHLTAAHDAVVRARSQLETLDPVVVAADDHHAATSARDAAAGRLGALGHVVAQARYDAALVWGRRVSGELAQRADERERAGRALELERERRTDLVAQRDLAGGERLRTIERLLTERARVRDERRAAMTRFGEVLVAAGLPSVGSATELVERQRELAGVERRAGADAAEADVEIDQATVALATAEQESIALREEIASLEQRRSSIPREHVSVRRLLCEELGIDVEEVPFVGELLRVRDDHARWEGAAERVLRGFALSLVVPDARYRDVARWLDAHHVGLRLVYHRVPADVTPARRPRPDGATLLDALEVADGPYADWLDAELVGRADYQLVADVEQFARARRAVTSAGQVKHSATHHEKNDARRVDDRGSYVLGWDNRSKVDLLLTRAAELTTRLEAVRARQKEAKARRGAAEDLRLKLAPRSEYGDWERLDWRSVVAEIDALGRERLELERGSADLVRLNGEIVGADEQIAVLGTRVAALDRATGRLLDHEEAAKNTAERALVVLRVPLADEAVAAVDALRDAMRADLEALVTRADDVRESLDDLERSVRERTEVDRDRAEVRARRASNALLSAMKDFRIAYPELSNDLTEDVAGAAEYRELRDRLVRDDLPRFETEFKRALNTETIREVAALHARLDQHESQIRKRIGLINGSLGQIEYNPGRYIELLERPTADPQVRDFRSELRSCMDETLGGGDEQYSERKFEQVKHLVDRFRGREGYTQADKDWTAYVTDVRNWFVFSASERYQVDHAEHEHYSGSGGKSGGQKEKLAFTVLAASLAYQFRIDPAERPSSSFRFVVIDEAFGRGSDESTRFGLDLFGRLGLQLLVVTPLTKIAVIEPFVSAVGFVANPTGAASQLQNLTITEFRRRRAAAHASLRPDEQPEPRP